MTVVRIHPLIHFHYNLIRPVGSQDELVHGMDGEVCRCRCKGKAPH